MVTGNTYRIEIARKLRSLIIVEDNGCHTFTGHIDCEGRARLWWRGLDGTGKRRHDKAFRVAYALTHDEEIPLYTHAHHTCLNSSCVNGTHIIPLTPKEHAAEHRRIGKGQINNKPKDVV